MAGALGVRVVVGLSGAVCGEGRGRGVFGSGLAGWVDGSGVGFDVVFWLAFVSRLELAIGRVGVRGHVVKDGSTTWEFCRRCKRQTWIPRACDSSFVVLICAQSWVNR